LVALNRLWNLSLPVDRLAQIGLSLGADVPVFVRGRAAFAEGVGERLTPLYPPEAPAETNYLILKPKVSVSTALVFGDPELTRDTPPITIHGFLTSGGRNDCTAVVRRRYAEVALALDCLSLHGDARMTGTGACVFIDCETMARGREIIAQLPGEFDAFLVRGLNDSPLLARLED
jgi:4-diphosphocytidyl-2-C-methyl-D-erythritol kinase